MSSNGSRASKPKPILAVVTGSQDVLSLSSHVMRQAAAPVDFNTVSRSERWDLVRGLFAAMHTGSIGVGLAAPMTGVRLRVVVIAINDKPLALFNPKVIETSGPQSEAVEANLSLPGVKASVTRPQSVTVTWQSVNSGQERTATFEGWSARVVQHEIEILDGGLFIDHTDAPPVGLAQSDEERARIAVADWFDDGSPELPLTENFRLALLPPSLDQLDTILTKPAAAVKPEQVSADQLRSVVTGMMKVLYGQRGVGLAAPQVGLGLRMTVIDSGEDEPLALINPTIVDREEREEVALEGCLSIPGWRGEVSRSTAVKVRADTVAGESVDRDFSGYLARIVQHELDHLDGVLFTSRMDPTSDLTVTDGGVVADELTESLKRFETQESRRRAARAKATKPSAARRTKKRRR
jgi:peptide deformylase